MVTLNTGTVSQVIVGLAGIWINETELSYPTSSDQVGYTDDGCALEYTPDNTEIEVAEENHPIDIILVKEEFMASLAMAENTLQNLNLALMGADNSVPSMVRIQGNSESKFHSMLIEGAAPGKNSGLRQIWMPKVGSMGKSGIPYKKNQKQIIPVEFKALKGAYGYVAEIRDFWDFTIATGSVAYVSTKKGMRLSSETSGSPDTLDTISGGSSGDTLVLFAKDPTNEAITITDDNGSATSGSFAIGDNDGTDYVLDDARKWIAFSSDGTSWTETYRAPTYA